MNTNNLSAYSTTQGEGSTFFSFHSFQGLPTAQAITRAGSITTPLTTEPYLWQQRAKPIPLTHIYRGSCSVVTLIVLTHTTQWCMQLFFLRSTGILFCLSRESRSNHAARIGSYIKYCLVRLLSRTPSARFLLFIIPAASGGNKELQELH